MRNSFAFYHSWWEAIKNLPRDVQGDVLTAIVEYGLTGATTEQLKPITKAMLTMVKTQIDIDNKRFENGKKGGRKKPTSNQTRTKPEPNPNQIQTKTQPSSNQRCGLVSGEKDVSDGFPLQPLSLTSEKDKKENTSYEVSKKNEKERRADTDLTASETTPPPDSAPPPSPKCKVFVKPTVEEVRAYCSERHNGVDAQMWYDFYESKGWMVGSNHMKDWKAAVRTWEKRNNTTISYGRKEQQRFGNTKPGDFAGKGFTDI